MRLLVRFLFASACALAVFIGIAWFAGSRMPREHEASSGARIGAPIDSVWQAIADFPSQPSWRSDVVAVKALPARNGHPVWEQQTRQGAWPLEITHSEPPVRLTAAITDSAQGFGGTWTWALEPDGAGTRVTITEKGYVDSPLFRFLMNVVFGPTTTQRQYLRDLARRFGDTVSPITL